MISQSVFPLNFKESLPLSPLAGQRILSLKIPQPGMKFVSNEKTPKNLKALPLYKSRACEILACFQPPDSTRFKYSRLGYETSASPKKNFMLKPLRRSFDMPIKKNLEGLKIRGQSKAPSRKIIGNRRITIFDKGPKDLVLSYLQENENSDSDESFYLEKKNL